MKARRTAGLLVCVIDIPGTGLGGLVGRIGDDGYIMERTLLQRSLILSVQGAPFVPQAGEPE
jgi:hypothetical protein